ncbi:hypothetical protein ACWOAH_00970 [Vagococcus vulneris]|uniref:Uncharacterized protein n=1 Tax=Vagococcus vulneris TaxID=1977869 RepID=A0A430A270_9ENTE|nr:hypothetical protein [Vagococcus vulneris]RSU00541.1 hypothetical protein CBF37_00570 [Vagococcus vulneris]
MTIKRFVQLFICYIISILIPFMIINYFDITSQSIQLVLYIVVGFVLLTLPLTIMTINKNKKY